MNRWLKAIEADLVAPRNRAIRGWRWLRYLRYRDWGRRTCGYCGYGWRHRSHCPLNGWIARVKDEWYP
jgi:hypothetical protein